MQRKLVAMVLAVGLVTTANATVLSDEVAKIKAATARYQDVNVALSEGFIPDPSGVCVSAAGSGLPADMGAMGIHYLNPGLLGLLPPGGRVDGTGTNVDFSAPSILLYEPQADGSLELVGVENLIFQAAWAAAGNSAPPMFAGAAWYAMADDAATGGDEAHGFAPHYDQHVWSQRENLMSAVVPFNPNVSCDKK
ncbi:MAG: hypothetical protein ACC631_04950 [Halocynthiibacter sp.]